MKKSPSEGREGGRECVREGVREGGRECVREGVREGGREKHRQEERKQRAKTRSEDAARGKRATRRRFPPPTASPPWYPPLHPGVLRPTQRPLECVRGRCPQGCGPLNAGRALPGAKGT